MTTTVTRAFDAPAERTLSLLGRVLRGRPHLLTLIDVVGGHPLAGGTLRYALPSATGLVSPGAFWGHLGASVRELSVAIEPLGDACKIRLTVAGRVSTGAAAELESALTGIERALVEDTVLAPAEGYTRF